MRLMMNWTTNAKEADAYSGHESGHWCLWVGEMQGKEARDVTGVIITDSRGNHKVQNVAGGIITSHVAPVHKHQTSAQPPTLLLSR